ncbi:MAG: hypothetical protein A2Y72_06695 [Chloroflexi bacterium RBG_13_53_26]|nr:MAG: hypothetical protein A2Y72_06695 [Chloroflexi bacterium RBG_13_53_26]
MSRRPRVTGQAAVRALCRIGFEMARQRGSHMFLKHADGRATVVPVHAGEVLGPGLVSKILRDARLTQEEFRELLE